MEGGAKRCLNPSVAMIPWLAHGHISPFLELAKRLSKRNFHIFFFSSTVNLSPLKHQLLRQQQQGGGEFSYFSSIDLIDLSLPSLPSLPPQLHTTKGLPSRLLPTLQEAFDSSLPNLLNMIHTLDPDLFIYDYNFPWHLIPSEDESNPLNQIPAVMFIPSSAAVYSLVSHSLLRPNIPYALLPPVGVRRPSSNTAAAQYNSNGTRNRIFQGIERSCSVVLVKSLREIEGKFMDDFFDLTEKRAIPVGPLVREVHGHTVEDDVEDHVIGWLDKEEESSTVYVSSGSEFFPTEEEFAEIAYGVEMSKVGFIWVVRFPKGEEVEIGEALPDGFSERTKGRGLVVEGWAPQVKILKHPSIGGFVSHCGWGSLMEAMTSGVPIIAMPMLYDQPLNTKLVTEIGVGMEIVRNGDGEFERSEIARVIREVVAENGGEVVRRKARELHEKVSNRGEEEMDAVAQELLQL